MTLDKIKNFYKEKGNISLPIAEESFKNFSKIGFPTPKNEEWKYTDVSSFVNRDYNWDSKSLLTKSEVQSFFIQNIEANHLVFINGKFKPEFSEIHSPKSEVYIEPLNSALENNVESVLTHFAKKVDHESNAFSALNIACATDGMFLSIPKGVTVILPILIYFISDSRYDQVFTQAHNIYVANENSEATVSEVFVSIGAQAAFSNCLTEISLASNARLSYHKIQTESGENYHVGTTQVHQLKDSVFTGTTISLSGKIIRNNLNIILDDQNCEGNMNGLYLIDGDTHVDNHTIADHAKPNSVSNELYKGILSGHSTGVFNGKIFVRQDAQKTQAYQSNKNILLSDTASMNTKPQLEIWADDVKCSHGATSGQLDDQALFYLRARGIGEATAKALLVKAFAEEVVNKIQQEPLRDHLMKLIENKLIQS